MEFFDLCPKLCCRLAGVSFYGPCSTWRVDHLDQVILLVWPSAYGNVDDIHFMLPIKSILRIEA